MGQAPCGSGQVTRPFRLFRSVDVILDAVLDDGRGSRKPARPRSASSCRHWRDECPQGPCGTGGMKPMASPRMRVGQLAVNFLHHGHRQNVGRRAWRVNLLGAVRWFPIAIRGKRVDCCLFNELHRFGRGMVSKLVVEKALPSRRAIPPCRPWAGLQRTPARQSRRLDRNGRRGGRPCRWGTVLVTPTL